jgi:hypothetical protein
VAATGANPLNRHVQNLGPTPFRTFRTQTCTEQFVVEDQGADGLTRERLVGQRHRFPNLALIFAARPHATGGHPRGASIPLTQRADSAAGSRNGVTARMSQTTARSADRTAWFAGT